MNVWTMELRVWDGLTAVDMVILLSLGCVAAVDGCALARALGIKKGHSVSCDPCRCVVVS